MRRAEVMRVDAERLAARAKSGEREALADLCELMYPLLHRYFTRLLRSCQGADDLAQATLMRMMEKLETFRALPGSKFEGWLFRIAHNLFIDQIRASRDSPAEIGDRADDSPGPEHSLIASERADAVRQAVDGLDTELRSMVIMRYELDMSYSAIAAALKITQVRVKWRLNDALKKLRKTLGGEEVIA